MTFLTNTAQDDARHLGILISVLVALAIGFVVGLQWPHVGSSTDSTAAPIAEDWHGNVRRSYWTE